MHSIGILAHSTDGAALCFLEMVRASARRLGEHEHPEIVAVARGDAPLPTWRGGTFARAAGPK